MRKLSVLLLAGLADLSLAAAGQAQVVASAVMAPTPAVAALPSVVSGPAYASAYAPAYASPAYATGVYPASVYAPPVAPVLACSANPVAYASSVVAEQVVVSPAHYETRAAPAQYEAAVRQEVVTPERVVRHTDPAVYETVEEVREVTPEKVVYRNVRPQVRTVAAAAPVGGPGAVVTAYGAAYALPTITPIAYGPAAVYGLAPVAYVAQAPYAVAQSTVVEAPGYELETVIPAKTRIEKRKVLVRPAQTYETIVPATYRSVSYMREVAPARTETVLVPAVYATRPVQQTAMLPGC